ncbi:hypothetical protein LQG66_05685 [Bradyrhizobium ontarionense]|uniref:Uncharacterized protein n=1 Tax=Bradyrhizobium ontarionense TaxID=2898149 RepID=A0ABY3REE2_9BRAD|nr:hypothetical protein [Bradyrhizobium sp. A19]UFZ05800.1 hypothetical protein LQG66_05685 [Bradyrhizobium sp. A19]
MQNAEKSNVVQFRDYASRRVSRTGAEPSANSVAAGQQGAILAWPRGQALYPGGIDDLPI